MITVEQQKEMIRKAVENGIETYRQAIVEKVGAYDQEDVSEVLSKETFEEMWEAYTYNDTMVRDYIIDIIK